MSHTVETSRFRSSAASPRQARQQWRTVGDAADVERWAESPTRLATAGVLLSWGSSIPTPRGLHARPVSVRPPEVWCVGQERGIARGSGAFLMLTGPAPGLVARGIVARAPFLAAREDRIGTVGQHIGVEWMELHSVTSRIPLDVLVGAAPDWQWLPQEPSGVLLPPELVECVDGLWRQWHHKPQRGHRVAEWVREWPSDDASTHSGPGARHRRLASVGHGFRLVARNAV